MTPSITDLFGEVPITHDDVDAWLRAVPRIEPTSHRANQYIKSYSVVEKIAQAKLRGLFDSIVTRPEPHPQWWARFHWRY